MRLTTTMFSYILILLGILIFQSTYAARDIFTINNEENNFGTPIISSKEREQFEGRPNELVKDVPLQKPFAYFSEIGNSENPSKIYVSSEYFILLKNVFL